MTGDELREFRAKRGLSQQALGELLGYKGLSAQITVQRWEKGVRPIPMKHIRKLAEIFDIPTDKFIP